MKTAWQWIPIAFTLGVLITWKSGNLHNWWFPVEGLKLDIARIERGLVATRMELADWQKMATEPCTDCFDKADELAEQEMARELAIETEGDLRADEAALELSRAALRRITY